MSITPLMPNRASASLHFHTSEIRALVAGLIVAVLLSAAALGQTGRPTLSPSQRGLQGTLVVRGDEVVASENPDQLMVPASVLKLVVVAAALHHLGPDYRARTELLGVQPDESGLVGSDLVIVGAGDPTWNDEHFDANPRQPLESLVGDLRAAGVRRIGGDLIVDASRFPGPASSLEWTVTDVTQAYGAPTSAIAVDENLVRLRMAPGNRVGAAARFRGDGLEIDSEATTVGSDRHGKGTVQFQPDWGRPKLRVRGEYPISEGPFNIRLAAPHPEQVAGTELLRILGEHDIEVDGELRVERTRSLRRLPRRAFFDSPPLSEWLAPILTDSNNWYAEMLLRVLAYEVEGQGRLDTGLEVETEFLEEVVGVPQGSFALDDASGLSPTNLITARTVIELLRFVERQEWCDVFFSALATPGDGTLGPSWGRQPSIQAKTGTLRYTQSLAGVLDPESEGRTLFAVLLNHRVDDRGPRRREISRSLWRWRARPD